MELHRPNTRRSLIEAATVVESALEAMIAQDIAEHMRWIDDDVKLDEAQALPLTAKLNYLRENAPILAPGSGIRLVHYEVTEVGASGPDEQWVSTILTFDVPKDGRLFPSGPVEYVSQRSQASYAVRGDRIVQVRTQSLPQMLSLSFG